MKAGVGNVNTFQDLSWQAPLQFLCEVPVRCAVFTPGKGLSRSQAKFTELGLRPWNSAPTMPVAAPSLFPHPALPLRTLELQCLCRPQHYLGLLQ